MDTLGAYELGNVYCGECASLMAELPECCIDLTVTSPPYDNLRDYRGYTFDFGPIAAELFRVTKRGGVVTWIVGDETKNFCESLSSFKQAIYFVESCGFNLLDTMFYQKANYAPAYPSLRRYAGVVEYMFILAKGKPKTFHPIQSRRIIKPNKRVHGFRQTDGTIAKKTIDKRQKPTKDATNLWVYSTGGNSATDKLAFQHPAIFPEALARDHILSWSNPSDVVLDPMCGSGTTLKMAKRLGRQYLGFDISEEYVELARQRVEQANPPLFTI